MSSRASESKAKYLSRGQIVRIMDTHKQREVDNFLSGGGVCGRQVNDWYLLIVCEDSARKVWNCVVVLHMDKNKDGDLKKLVGGKLCKGSAYLKASNTGEYALCLIKYVDLKKDDTEVQISYKLSKIVLL